MSTLPAALVDALSKVRSVGVITGAGVSAESGIATYRGQGGVYDDPEEGDRTIEALTASTLQSDPDRTWRAIARVARESAGAQPNAGHMAIAGIERRVERFVLLTQNVDGLHQSAGSRNIIDIHGTVAETTCMSCERQAAFDAREELARLEAAPRCRCGGVLRPNAVLFGEMLPHDKVRRMHAELIENPPGSRARRGHVGTLSLHRTAGLQREVGRKAHSGSEPRRNAPERGRRLLARR